MEEERMAEKEDEECRKRRNRWHGRATGGGGQASEE